MKRFTLWLFSLVLVLSLVLGACAPAPVAEAEVIPTTAPVEPTPVPVEPTATPEPVIEPATDAQLDAAFTTFLGDMEAYNTIGLETLNTALIENPPFLLDVRTEAETAEKGRIEGSVTIPLNELGENLAYLPSFDTPIVSYCGSGWRCTIALTALEALGWQDVKGLKGGSYGGWVEAGYPTVDGVLAEPDMLNAAEPDPSMVMTINEMLARIPEGYGGIAADALNTEIIENPDLILVDVRTPAEVEAQGAVDAPNVVYVPLEEFITLEDQWPADESAPIAVYCGSGHRSTIAMTILWSYGYTDVSSLKGGFSEWKAAGYPVVGGEPSVTEKLDAAFTTFLDDMEAYNTTSLEALNTALIENPPFLLDVRTEPETTEKGHIEGSVTIPLNTLGENLAYLPSFDTPIVSYCGSGWRCTIALTALEALGWEDVKGLKGGSYGGWVEAGYPTVAGLPPAPEMLNAAEPDPALVEVIGGMLANVPEGYGVIKPDALNTEIIENPDLILIDARTEAEVAEKGVIDAPNLLTIPLEEFISMKDQWPAQDAPIVVYCGSGHRSTIGMTILWSYGYSDVRSLNGGFSSWAEAGYPVVAPGG